MKRLVCRLLGHDPLTVIDEGEFRAVSAWSTQFQTIRQHRECRRCQRRLSP